MKNELNDNCFFICGFLCAMFYKYSYDAAAAAAVVKCHSEIGK